MELKLFILFETETTVSELECNGFVLRKVSEAQSCEKYEKDSIEVIINRGCLGRENFHIECLVRKVERNRLKFQSILKITKTTPITVHESYNLFIINLFSSSIVREKNSFCHFHNYLF